MLRKVFPGQLSGAFYCEICYVFRMKKRVTCNKDLSNLSVVILAGVAPDLTPGPGIVTISPEKDRDLLIFEETNRA